MPVVGIASGWEDRWHAFRRLAARCDILLAESAAADRFHRAGFDQARPATLAGLPRSFLDHPWPEPTANRDIDVLFAGNIHPAARATRFPWLCRLAALAERHNVVVRTGVPEEEYRGLLGRTKLVFDPPRTHSGSTRRAFQAAAAGAALLRHRADDDAHFVAGREAIEYDEHDFEQVVTRFLSDGDVRITIATAARERAGGFAFERFWDEAMAALEPEWSRLRERAAARRPWDPADRLRARAAVASSCSASRDHSLLADLTRAGAERLGGQPWTGAWAGAAAAAGAPAATLLDPLRLAAEATPADLVAAISCLEAAMAAGDDKAVRKAAGVALTSLNRTDSVAGDPLFFPPGPHSLRADWERAAWEAAGDPAAERDAKRRAAAGHLHTMLGRLTGERWHLQAAADARPDVPAMRAALGCHLAAAGDLRAAVPHLAAAVAADPFDRSAARALAQALADLGDRAAVGRLARQRRALAKAAPQFIPAEAWFADAPPVGDELASIIVLCCNEVEVTRLCLESVFKHTRQPYELVLIDNGSTDGTPAYLDEVPRRPGPERVTVVRNDDNRGYPGGVNQGIDEARGDYLVLLNNDVVVTPRWLDRLVTCSLHDWPRIGLVGAVTNYAPPPQRVEPGYADLAGLDAFAARRAAEFPGQAMDSPRLTGFCLLVRKAAFDAIGKLDERFGLGFFDDDDLCLRARRAGFRLAIALDCYVHHFGSRTFRSLGVDTGAQLDANLDLYREKWGDAEAAKFRPMDLGPARPPAGARPRVSLTMIVKDEERYLPDCLASVRDLVDEIVIVDTGSKDRTKEIAASFGAKVFDFPWVDDFAAARNEALRHATGDWAFWMDADDRLGPADRERAKALFASLGDDQAAYVMKCRCDGEPGAGVTTVDHVRLFRLRHDVRWKYRVHEQILPALRGVGADVRWCDVAVTHVGYADPAARARKRDRDLRLLGREREEQPDDPFTLFNLGSVYHELDRAAEALPLLERSLELSHPRDSIVRKLHALVAQCHRRLGRPDEALAACARGRELYPDDEELLFVESLVRREKRDFAGAEACLRRLIGGTEGDHFGSVAEGLRGHKARHNLACLYLDTRRPREAEEEWRLVLAERPDFLPARIGLADACVDLKKWDELERQAAELERLGPPGETAAAVARGRGMLERGEVAAARWSLGRAARRFPGSVPLGMLWGQAAVREGMDREAEEALAGVLAVVPGHPEARFNLAVVRAQRRLRPGEELTLTAMYRAAREEPSAERDHLPPLYDLAKQCGHVTQVGVGVGTATTALLAGQPARLVCRDGQREPEVDLLARLAGRTALEFRPGEGWESDDTPTDLLVVDARRAGTHLAQALSRRSASVRRWVALLDESAAEESTEDVVGMALGNAGFRPEEGEVVPGFRVWERVTPPSA